MADNTLPTVAILAGGLATRMRPLTTKIPKILLDINGKPFIRYQLELLKKAGIRSVVLCVGYLGEIIQDEVGDGSSMGLDIRYSFDSDEKSLLGTGGAIQKALPLLGSEFYILYGDSYLDCDYADIHAKFVHSGKPALMTVFKNNGKWDTSNVHFENNQIVQYSKQSKTDKMVYIDYGLGLMKTDLWLKRFHQMDTPFDLADVYSGLSQEGLLAGYEVMTRFYEIGSHEGLQEIRQVFFK